MATLRESQRAVLDRDYVVARLERAGIPKQAAWDYHRAHQDKFLTMNWERLDEWLDGYVARFQTR